MRILTGFLAVLILTACSLVDSSTVTGPVFGTPPPFEGPAPRAVCGPGSQEETDIQGRVPLVDRASGRYLQPYRCNLEEIGHVGDGANWQMAWYDTCAYYSTAQSGKKGVQVVDVSNSQHPEITAQLTTPAFMDPWESLKTPAQKALLAGVGAGAIGTLNFDIYDVSYDCAHPRLLAALPVNGVSHEGAFAPDGRTYYGDGFLSPEVMVIDTTNPTTPKPITALPIVTHGSDLSPDSNTLYTTLWTGANGLWIYDVSLINTDPGMNAARVSAPAPLVGFVSWSDGGVAQQPLPVSIGGKPYIIFTDEGGLGMTRIIDVSDPKVPYVVSKLKDEIDMPDAAAQRSEDGATGSFDYQGHYCGVDSRENATAVACSYFWQGIRVFDIRDPRNPKEIAYYIPGASPDNQANSVTAQKGCTKGTGGETCTSAQVRFVKERGELWFTNQLDGFHVLKFTNNTWPFKD